MRVSATSDGAGLPACPVGLKCRLAWNRFLVVVVAGVLVGLSATAAAQPGPVKPRPRIGLALGGGAARGLAHIGVLQWLDEHRIPIDLIAGTSMGGLVGGAYATGMTPADMRALMRGTDWVSMLLPDSPFKDKTFRRKQDRRAFPARLELGLRHGVRLPSALNPGQGVSLMLDRMTIAYYDVERFDELPTPFRCLALDLRTGQPVVLADGPLARAMRATMAIPAVFTPVSLGDWLLVDGGAVNNVPGDVVRDMGADIVVAVDVSAGRQADAATAADNADILGVLNRTLDAMMAAGARKGLDAASIVVVPELQGFDSMSWPSSDALADRGYRAAEALADRLLPYALSEEEYRAHAASRESRRRSTLPVLASVEVMGVPPAEQAGIRAAFSANVGKPADPDRIEGGIRRVAGTDRYESIDYRIAAGPAEPGLLVTVHPKTYGPPFLALGLDVDNFDASHAAVWLSARLTTYDTLGAGSEIRHDLAIGTRQAYNGEVFRPIARSRFFAAPRASFSRDDRPWFDGEQQQGESRVLRAGAGLDVGVLAGHSAELRAGYDTAYVWGEPLIGTPPVGTFEGPERFASVRAAVDRQDGPVVPSRGLFARAQLRRYFETPRVSGDSETPLENPGRFWQGEFRSSVFVPIGRGDRIFLEASGGTSFGARPLLNDFSLGGPFRLGAFSPSEIRGPAYALGAAGFLKKAGRLLGGDLFVGGWYEAGSAFDAWNHAQWRQVVSGGAILDSLIGPIFAGGSVSFDGHNRFYIAIGPLWR
jgi:NTE family protein